MASPKGRSRHALRATPNSATENERKNTDAAATQGEKKRTPIHATTKRERMLHHMDTSAPAVASRNPVARIIAAKSTRWPSLAGEGSVQLSGFASYSANNVGNTPKPLSAIRAANAVCTLSSGLRVYTSF